MGGTDEVAPVRPSYDEVAARLCGPGGPFELIERQIEGRNVKLFKSAPATLVDIFSIGRSRGEGVYLVYEDESLTFAQLGERVDALAGAMAHELGVAKGERVAIAMRNYPEWIISYFATLRLGAVAVLLNGWWSADELAYGVQHSGSNVVIADPERAQRLAPTLGPDTTLVVCRGKEPGAVSFDELLAAGCLPPDVIIDGEDPATILYTSGTTGRPKGATSTHRAVVQALMAFACRGAIDAGRRPPAPDTGPAYPTCFILIVPLFHVTGCVPVMLGSLLSGAKLVIMRKWDPQRALELIERERVTNFVGVPTMAHDLLESPFFADFDTSSLVSVGGGGAPAPPELVRRIESTFRRGRPQIGYGMTETNAYGPGNNGDDYVAKPTSAGRVVPVMSVRVVGDDGTVRTVGQVGEIEFAGPNLISGYWDDPISTAELFDDGWLRTGDLGYLDEDNFVYVVDRAKDMILRGGENIFCAEVEAALYEHDAVYEVAVFGLPHERLGEELAAAVVVREGTTVEPSELQEFVAARLAAFKVPSQMIFLSEPLPRNAAGKVLKRELRDRAVAGEFTS